MTNNQNENIDKRQSDLTVLEWIINFLVSFALLGLGVLLGFTIKVPAWNDISMPMIGCGSGILAAVIFSGIFVSIKAYRDDIVETMLTLLSATLTVAVSIVKGALSIAEYTFSWLWILAIVVIFPVFGMSIAALMIICVPMLIFTVLATLVSCAYTSLTTLFNADNSNKKAPHIVALVISIVAVSVSVLLNVFNFVYLIPEQLEKIYTISYVAPDGTTISDPTGRKLNKYYFKHGADEKYLYTVKQDGYEFAGWYYDPEFTIPFESFGPYEKKGDITLYAKMDIAAISINYSGYGYNYYNSVRIYDLGGGVGYLNKTYILPTLQAPSGYAFIGWSEKHVNDKDFISGNYTLIDSIFIDEDRLSFNLITVFPMFVEIPTTALNINVPVNISTESSWRNPQTNRRYYVSGSSKTEYTLIMNHGDSYDHNTYEADYFVAHVYLADGTLVTSISSKFMGGRFSVPANTDFYISFVDYKDNGEIAFASGSYTEYTRAEVMLATGHHEYESLAGALNVANNSTVDLTAPTQINFSISSDVDHITDDYYAYSFKTINYTKTDSITEFGLSVKTSKTLKTLKASVAVFKNGVFIDSFSIDYLDEKNADGYAKILDNADLEDGSYQLVVSITCDLSFTSVLSSEKLSFIAK